jgi:hypothetical protein
MPHGIPLRPASFAQESWEHGIRLLQYRAKNRGIELVIHAHPQMSRQPAISETRSSDLFAWLPGTQEIHNR